MSDLKNHMGWPQGCDIFSDYYSLHGISLKISSNEPGILSILKSSLKHFSTKENEPPCFQFGLFVCKDLNDAPFRPDPDLPAVSFNLDLKYFTKGQNLYTTVGRKACLMCRIDEKWATGYMLPSVAKDSWSLSQLVFYPVLAEMLKEENIFNMHAALAANKNNDGILITAPTGHGKSTTLVNLIRSGYKFLSDDITFVKNSGPDLLLLGFPEPVNITPQSLEFFPELQFLKNTPKKCHRNKHSFRIEEFYKQSLTETARPKWIVFPQIRAEKPTQILPLAKSEALSLLIPQSITVANKSVVARHLSAVTRLVQESACLQLLLGHDASERVPGFFAD